MIAEIKARIARPMPFFWKKLQKRSAATSAAFTALVIATASLSTHLPAILPTVFSYAAAFFGTVAATCMLAVDDPAGLPAEIPASTDTATLNTPSL